MSQDPGSPEVLLADPVKYCEFLIDWYERHGRANRRMWKFFQGATVVLGATTPLMLLVDGLPKVVAAFPSALASLSAALIAIFGWRDNWGMFASTAEQLKFELLKYRNRATKPYKNELDDNEALANFVERVESLVSLETDSWRKQLLGAYTNRQGGTVG
jgi:hypothetical protein